MIRLPSEWPLQETGSRVAPPPSRHSQAAQLGFQPIGKPRLCDEQASH